MTIASTHTITRVMFAEPAFLPGTRTPTSQVTPGGPHSLVVTEDAIGIWLRAPTGHAERVPWGNVRSVSYAPAAVLEGPSLADAEPRKVQGKAVA